MSAPLIGLLGGTFDPIHYGHLRTAHEVKRRLALSSLRVMPAASPPHRQPPLASAEQRVHMAQLAVGEFPGLVVDDREIRRGGVSYTVITLEELRRENPQERIGLLVGADAFLGIPRWHRWERLLELTHLIVMQRPGEMLLEPSTLPPWAASRWRHSKEELLQQAAGGVLVVPVTPQDISATRLRAMIARGETPSAEILPPAVWTYIQQHGLYRSFNS